MRITILCGKQGIPQPFLHTHGTRFTEARTSARHQCEASTWRHEAHFAAVVRGWCSWRFRRRWSRHCWHGRLTGSSSLLLLLLLSRGCKDFVWAPTEWLTACRNWRRRFLVNFSRNRQHFRIPTQPVILVVNGHFSDFYSAVIIRQALFSPSVQPLFDLVLKLHGLAMSGLAISASPSA